MSSSKQSVAKIFANLNFLLQKAASAFFVPIECHKVSSAALKHFKPNKSKWVIFTSTYSTKTSLPILAQVARRAQLMQVRVHGILFCGASYFLMVP